MDKTRELSKVKELSIRKDFFKLIETGKKDLEFRKLKKGITNGVHELIDSDTEETLGYAILNPIAVNPEIEDELVYETHEVTISTGKISGYVIGHIDPETYKFVKEKYIDKQIDFVCYHISLVSERIKDYIERLKDGKKNL